LHDVSIHQLRIAELASLQRLIYQTIDSCYSGVYPPRAVQFFKEFHSEEEIKERHRTGEILVVEQDGHLVATGSILGNDILGLFVNPGLQRQGLGKALMAELENRARAKGCTELKLSVSLPSKRFYESLGYEMIEQCSTDVGEGQHLVYWKARKPIARPKP
jgi:GNAT superfamily N-acetyltransferase